MISLLGEIANIPAKSGPPTIEHDKRKTQPPAKTDG